MKLVFLFEKKLANLFSPWYRKVLLGFVIFFTSYMYWFSTITNWLLSQQITSTCGTTIHASSYANCITSVKESIGLGGFLFAFIGIILGLFFDILVSILFPIYVSRSSKHMFFVLLKFVIIIWILSVMYTGVVGMLLKQ